MSIIQTERLTPDDLLTMPEAVRFELVDGELLEKNASVLSSRVQGILLHKLESYCEGHLAGPVFPGSLGIRCFRSDPTKVRRPDVFFVKKDRFQHTYWEQGFLTIAPDLAAEVVSPNDLASELSEKVEEYLAEGVSIVWIIDPEIKTTVIHRSDGTVTKLHANDELSGESVIPGFRCKVADLFPALST